MGKNQEESLPKAKNGQAVTKQLVQKESGASLPPQVTKQVQPEGGWGWVVCFTSLCANGTVFGCINTFGILYIAMLDQFKGDDPNISFKTAWVGSVCTGLTFLLCMIASILSDRVGIRKVAFTGGCLAFVGMLSSAFVEELMMYYLTYGVILGCGFAFAYAPSLVILGHYFKKRLGLVNGIVTFGSSVFTIIYSLVLPFLLGAIGLKYTLVCLSGLMFLLMPCALTWKPRFRHEATVAELTFSRQSLVEHMNDCCQWTHKFLNVRIWRNRGYVIWVLSVCVSLFGYFVPFVHLVKHTNDVFPGSNGNLLPMSISITSGLSRMVFGLVADVKCRISRTHMQQIAFLLLGVTTMCIPFANSFTALIIICLLMGICDGLFVCFLGPIAFDLVGEHGASQALGFMFGLMSIPMTVGPPVAGYLYDSMGTYRIAFHIAGAPPVIGAILMFFIPRHKEHIPAVLEVEEFIGVSMPDIYSNRNEAAQSVSENTGPSTVELEVISGEEVEQLLKIKEFPSGVSKSGEPSKLQIEGVSKEELEDIA